jgi:hypothetical protein
MTAIEASNNIKAPERSDIRADSLKYAMSKVIGALSGKKTDPDKIPSHLISEDVLFAANVYNQLSERSSKLADDFLSSLSGNYRNNLAKETRQPLFKAVDSFLAERAKKGQLSKADRRQITRQSFAQSQLDSRLNRLSTKAIQNSSGLEALLKKNVNGDQSAPRQVMKNFRQRIDANIRSKETLQRLKERFEIAAGVKQKISAAPIPKNEFNTSAADFVFQPVSSADGNAVVFLPLKYSKEVTALGVFDSYGDLLAEFKFSGFHKDGRAIWRNNSPGSELKSMEALRLIFSDGGMMEYLLPQDNRAFYERTVA